MWSLPLIWTSFCWLLLIFQDPAVLPPANGDNVCKWIIRLTQVVEWGLVNAAKVICDRLIEVLCKSSGLPPRDGLTIWPCERTQRRYRSVRWGESRSSPLHIPYAVFHNNAFLGRGKFGVLCFPMQNVLYSVHGWHQASSDLPCYGLRSCGELCMKAHYKKQLKVLFCLVMYSCL